MSRLKFFLYARKQRAEIIHLRAIGRLGLMCGATIDPHQRVEGGARLAGVWQNQGARICRRCWRIAIDALEDQLITLED